MSPTTTLPILGLTFAALAVVAAPAQAKPSTPAAAKKVNMTATPVPVGAVKVDGFVTDWEGIEKHDIRALTRGEKEYDWTGPRDLSMLVQLQYDAQYLYMAIEVRDNLVTNPKRRKGGDFVEVWFDGGPLAKAKRRGAPGRLRMLRLKVGGMTGDGLPEAEWGYPKALKGKPDGLLLDGSIRNTGYFFEVGIPLEQVSSPPPGLEPLGIAFIARDWDYDDPNEDQAAVASAPFDGLKTRNPNTMGRLTMGGAASIQNGFSRIKPDAAGKKVIGEQFVDVGGDGRREWISLVADHYISVSGIGLGRGQNYFYEMEHRGSGTYNSIEPRDFNGDGKAELVVRYTVQSGPVQQEFVAIYHYAQDTILLVFFHEVGNKGPGWSVTNSVAFKPDRRSGRVDIVVSDPKAAKVTKANYIDVDSDTIDDWSPVLLPWEPEQTRVFEWSVEAGQFLKRGN